MAYSFTFDIAKVVVRDSRQKLFRVTISETDVQTDSEAVITGLPDFGTIVRYRSTLLPGSAATTIDPTIGTASGFAQASQDEVARNLTADTHIDNRESLRFYSEGGVLYVRSQPDANGASVVTEMMVNHGWDT
jgi:hypothetical protein